MVQQDEPRAAGADRVDAASAGRSADAVPAVPAAPSGEADAGSGGTPDAESAAPAEARHALRVVVWDTPPAVVRGARFVVKIGVSCSSGCRPAGWRIEVRGHRGERWTTTALGDEPWPGTDALYPFAAALAAPRAEGLYTWEAAALADGLAVAHAGGSVRFGVRVVPPPSCVVTVVAVDAESGTPVEGARVVAHPYRAVTGAGGAAELRVAPGEYRLFVSGRGYAPFRFEGALEADATIRAVLAPDRELSEADVWA